MAEHNGEQPRPSPSVGTGRDGKGRFAGGNKAARGNLMNVKVQRLRVKFLRCVTDKDVAEVTQTMVRQAREGDAAARRELYDRLFGKSRQPLELSGPDSRPLLDLEAQRCLLTSAAAVDVWLAAEREALGQLPPPDGPTTLP
jgi:hypothetical protein